MHVQVFAHNDVEHLEVVLRRAIAEGQPRIHRPWKKILIVVEGIYSMEGEMANLAGIVALKKKYKVRLCSPGLLTGPAGPAVGWSLQRMFACCNAHMLARYCIWVPSLSHGLSSSHCGITYNMRPHSR